MSWTSAALQIPVIVAILYLLARGLMSLGTFYGRWSDRQRLTRRIAAAAACAPPTAQPAAPQACVDPVRNNGGNQHRTQMAEQGVIRFANQLQDTQNLRRQPFLQTLRDLRDAPPNEALHQRILTAFELQADRQLSLYRTMTRIGPLLGLMGTLIPLGPALVGLASGDISLLARKMEVAFATTVVGLVIGAIGYLLHQAAQRWALDDLSLLELASATWLDADDAAPPEQDMARPQAAAQAHAQHQTISQDAPA